MKCWHSFSRIVGLIVSLAILNSGCIKLGAPAATVPPSPTLVLVDGSTSSGPTLTPFSPMEVKPTLTPTDTEVPPVVETATIENTPVPPSPTDTALPPMPDFGQILTLGEGGGAGGACMAPLFPPPTIYAVRSSYGAHVAGLCVYQVALPLGQPVHLTLTSPDGTLALQGDFRATDAGGAVWLGYESVNANGYAGGSCKEGMCDMWGIEFWWPANLPSGIWYVSLSWDGGQESGAFDTGSGMTLPEFSVRDSLVAGTLRPSASLAPCHPVAGPTGLSIAGQGYSPGEVVYVPVYEQTDGHQYRFLDAQAFVADGNGNVSGLLAGTFRSGKQYTLAGLTDATLSLFAPDDKGSINFTGLDNATDCFVVP